MSNSEKIIIPLEVWQSGDHAADRVIERGMVAGMKAANATANEICPELDPAEISEGLSRAVFVLLEVVAKQIGHDGLVERLVSKADDFVAGIEELGQNLTYTFAAHMELKTTKDENTTRHPPACKCPACADLLRN